MLKILPFNLKEAQRAGEFANILFTQNKVSITSLHPRAIIPKDAKLFAQADINKTITHFVTSDVRSKNTLKMLKNVLKPKFEIISIDVPFSETFGILDL